MKDSRCSIVATGLSSAMPDPARSSLFAGQATHPPSPYATPTCLAPSFAGHTPARPSCHAWPSSFVRHTPARPLRHTHTSGCPCLQATRPAVPHAPEQEDDDTTQQQTDAINERSLGIKLEVENTVQWRWVKGNNGEDVRSFPFVALPVRIMTFLSANAVKQSSRSLVGG